MTGELIVVATPIGNLGDLSERARATLVDADVICCEDTRRTRVLLSAVRVPAAGRLVSLRAHNEAAKADWVADRVAAGARVAYVTDAGTPGVSDPGARLVAIVARRGLSVTTVPGPSSAIVALVVSGLSMERFCVEGFLPRRGGERSKRLTELRDEPRTTVVFESPARVVATLKELADALGPDRPAAVCRELTKRHEEVMRGSLGELASSFAAATDPKGEFVVVLEGAPARTVNDDEVERAVAASIAGGATIKDTAASVAEALGVSKRRVYEEALRLSGARG